MAITDQHLDTPSERSDASGGTESAKAIVSRLRATYASGRTRPLEWRREQLRALQRLLHERESELIDALTADLGKPALEGWMTEIGMVDGEIDHLLQHLSSWTSDQRVRLPAKLQPAKARIVTEPLGTVLVISPWNYPMQLLLLPMAYALGAGNTVVGKPSELTPKTSRVIAKLVPEYLDSDAVAIVEGDASVSTELLAERWDHIFFTGGGRVGRIVMEAAARHLTPVTLELGGKSPTIVDRTANIRIAARRIAWGKFLNSGQTCIAPDYVLVERSVEAELLSELETAVREFYGSSPSTSADYSRIVSDSHLSRLQGFLSSLKTSRIVFGGETDAKSRYFAPTVLAASSWDEPVMQEEIFGPILPVLTVENVDEAIKVVNEHDKPLALYVFSEEPETTERVLSETSSGGACVNGVVYHVAAPDLPFGGVGPSGMGAYHGKAGIDTFSHHKSVMARNTKLDPSLTYPPFNKTKEWVIRKLY